MPARPNAHRLSDAAFAALGAGRPDAATVSELRRAQLSRHLLLLRGIVHAAPDATARWFALLSAAEQQAPAAVRDVLRQPLVGSWAAGCLAALRAGVPPADAGVPHLAVVAATAAAAAGVPPPPDAPAPAAPLRRLATQHAGLRLDVALDDVDPLRARLGLLPTDALDDAALRHWRDCLDAAWRILAGRHRSHARVIAEVLLCVVPVRGDPAARGISASSAEAFGAVAMSAPADATALAVGLLHETQHSLLNAVLHLFDLHHPGQSLRYSPWRDDPRPASGLLHGAYAYLGVTDFWRVRFRYGGDPLAAFEFARWRAGVLTAADDLLAAGELTAAGTRFVGALRERVRPWLHEPVPPQVRWLAETANADHRLRWRLRNLTLPAAAVSSLVDAWRAGVPPPTQTFTATVRPTSRRILESNPRLDLIHRLLRAGTGPPEPPPEADRAAGGTVPGDFAPLPGDHATGVADVAYLRGDHAAAAHEYGRVVAADPHDRGAWAGLALATGEPALRRHPEVVAAVHLALHAVAEPADPLAVARWAITAR